MRLAGLVVACITSGCTAQGPDHVVTRGPLSDDDFYRLVACAAPPGGACRDAMIRWPNDRRGALRVGIAMPPPGYPAVRAAQAQDALDSAIGLVNEVGAAVHLEQAVPGTIADITIRLATVSSGETISGTGDPAIDGTRIGAAMFHLRWTITHDITRATIVLADDVPVGELLPVLLEELVQSLGLPHDIRNAYYTDRSVFAEDGNSVATLSNQDRMTILRHYGAE